MPRKKTDTQEKEENKASIEENFAQLEEIIKKLEAGDSTHLNRNLMRVQQRLNS